MAGAGLIEIGVRVQFEQPVGGFAGSGVFQRRAALVPTVETDAVARAQAAVCRVLVAEFVRAEGAGRVEEYIAREVVRAVQGEGAGDAVAGVEFKADAAGEAAVDEERGIDVLHIVVRVVLARRGG